MTLFDSSSFDLDAYLARIRFGSYDDARGRGNTNAGGGRPPARAVPDLDTLRRIALLHPSAIPFENLNPLLGRSVSLDIASIQEKLVRGGRGGWCFEHNLLLGRALSAIGFPVTGLSARVRWNVPPGVVRGRSHMVLHVLVDGAAYIVDAGFGGPTPTAPLRLEPGVEQSTPHEPFRLVTDESGFRTEVRAQDAWRPLYVFDLQPQTRADYEMPNWYLCTHPESHFLGRVMAARVAPGCRYALRNTDLAVHHRDGRTERRVLSGAAEIRQALEEVFGIAVPTGDEVDAMLQRVASHSQISNLKSQIPSLS